MAVIIKPLNVDGQAVVLELMEFVQNIFKTKRVNVDLQIELHGQISLYVCQKVAENTQKYANMPRSHKIVWCRSLVLKALCGRFEGSSLCQLHRAHRHKRLTNAFPTRKPRSRQTLAEAGDTVLIASKRFPNPYEVAMVQDEQRKLLEATYVN